MDKKTEGYWYDIKSKNFYLREMKLVDKNHSNFKFYKNKLSLLENYPIPIPNVLIKEEAITIYNLIKKLESKSRYIQYKGYSYSRITSERLGCGEFHYRNWIFPEDFAEHYVLKHRVKPSNEFLKYIGYEKSTSCC